MPLGIPGGWLNCCPGVLWTWVLGGRPPGAAVAIAERQEDLGLMKETDRQL